MTGEKESFLEQLQELGVVDISRSEKPVDQDSSEMLFKATRAKKVLEYLEGIDYSKDADFEAVSKATVTVDDDAVSYVEACRNRLMELNSSLNEAEKQMKARLPWGSYDKKALDSLSDLGYKVRFYSVDKKRFDQQWAELYPLQVIEEDEKKVWFVTVAPKNEIATTAQHSGREVARVIVCYTDHTFESFSPSTKN